MKPERFWPDVASANTDPVWAVCKAEAD
jgi:hypothetical protein